MASQKQIFLKKSKIAFDKNHRKTIKHNMSQYDNAVKKGKQRYLDIERAKERASFVKSKVMNNLPDYLEEFEKNIVSRGSEVLWAKNSKEAIDHITHVFENSKAKLLVKSKSMISEEIELNDYSEKAGVEPVETDLGEFIVQTANEKPYHILTPAMHKSKHDVAKLFHEKFDTPENATPEELTQYVRGVLRKKFTSAEIGVTGANFLVADVGGVALVENEGNGLMSVSFPKNHIVITGIEKVIPSINDLPLFLPLLSSIGTGQQVTVYNSLLLGPKQKGETFGPEKMVVVLIDNSCSEIYKEETHRDVLKCIRCGACLNACPIYKNVGGYTYNTEYTGPIGSVITPFMKGFDDFSHLSYACTVCGRCTEVCPVKIPLHNLLLLNRKKAVEKKLQPIFWEVGMKAYKFAFEKRARLDAVKGATKNTVLKCGLNLLGKNKKNPQFADQSFSRQSKNKNK
ncbi:MAG: lactate utilization protein [Mariniphaga sp.]|nr:lactate utilization protein [Mariniphaga sp.]